MSHSSKSDKKAKFVILHPDGFDGLGREVVEVICDTRHRALIADKDAAIQMAASYAQAHSTEVFVAKIFAKCVPTEVPATVVTL